MMVTESIRTWTVLTWIGGGGVQIIAWSSSGGNGAFASFKVKQFARASYKFSTFTDCNDVNEK